MNLSGLKRDVDSAFESVIDQGQDPDEIIVSLQIDDPLQESVWAKEEVDLHYDNDGQASGCVLVGYPIEADKVLKRQWISVKEKDSPHGIPVLLWSKEWVDEDFNPTGVREGHFVEGEGYTSCGWDACQDVFTTEENSYPSMWSKKVSPLI